jgi:hypothetical protein
MPNGRQVWRRGPVLDKFQAIAVASATYCADRLVKSQHHTVQY